MLQVILGSFGAFPIFNNRISRSLLPLERNIHLKQILSYPVLCSLPSCQQIIKAPGLLICTCLSFFFLLSCFRTFPLCVSSPCIIISSEKTRLSLSREIFSVPFYNFSFPTFGMSFFFFPSCFPSLLLFFLPFFSSSFYPSLCSYVPQTNNCNY